MSHPRGVLALIGATLIDGNGGAPIANSVVVITGNTIAAVGPASKVTIPDGANVIRAHGKTLLPGLIDAHIHLGASGGGAADPAEFTHETVAANLKTFLAFGVTSIMDMGANPHLREQKAALASGEVLGPRLFGVKYGITAPGSHPRGLLKRFRLESTQGPFTPVVDTVEEARAIIRTVADDRTDGVKIYHTRSEFPGNMCLDADKEKLKLEVLKVLVDEAHARGLRVFAHIAFPSEAREVVEAGVDVLAHPITHAESGAEEVLRLMAERNVSMHSTIVRVESYYGLKVDPFGLERLRGKVSNVILDSITKPGSVARLRHEMPGVTEDARRIKEITMANVRRALKAGIRIVLGTDSGAPGAVHGASVPRELELLNEAGLTPMQALSAATKNAAYVIGQGDVLGTVEAGKLADLVVVGDNPLTDIPKMRNVELVVKDGAVIEPRSLAF